MTNEYEALGKALAEAIDPVWVPEAVAAVVEFLTSDEAIERALNILGWNKRNRYGIRAALLAAVGGSDE